MLPIRSADEEAVPPLVVAAPPAPVPSSPAIHTQGLHKRYGHTVAVKSFSITVGRGEVFGFLGPNGAGKTTMVKMLLGLVRPTGGEGMVLGAPIGDREARRKVGYLPELFRFQPWLTAREVLVLHCRLLSLPKRSWGSAVDGSLEIVGLADRSDDKLGGFSKGMQQRLGLGVALLGEPDLVILDEPTSALDPVGRHDVRQITRDLRARGATVFLNTHLLEEAQLVCDRVAVIDKGTAIATGSLAELLGDHARVRLRVKGLPDGWWRQPSLGGDWASEGEWVTVAGIDQAGVPDLVARIVAQGGRIEAVIPEQQSLEDRFLELLGEQ
ncbi:MAG TPA: ABC transporter ATP-binding protein [Acidimicrobiales bacterium]|jgi:ABC-2 type transport system ATP-binding protein|nr:ABC transporter ATP-binding protein [Acidimicrobiales bacterium]